MILVETKKKTEEYSPPSGYELVLPVKFSEVKNKSVYPILPLTDAIKAQMKPHVHSVMHQEMKDILLSFINQIPHYTDEKGVLRCKCELYSFMIPMRPMSVQSKGNHCDALNVFIKTKAPRLGLFKNLQKLVYICAFLGKKRIGTDVDNMAGDILDAMKIYFGDDKGVTSLIIEKVMLNENYPENDLNYLENHLVIISDAMVRNDIIKI